MNSIQTLPRPVLQDELQMRRPKALDGHAVHQLIDRCPPLDENSLYCNLLQCTHFADTCVLALAEDNPVGFASAYLIPRQRDALFVWQIAVAPEVRNRGLGGRMLMEILRRPACANIRYLKTTITETNDPSWSLFRALARTFETQLERQVLFDRDTHMHRSADTEILVTIGPIPERR